MIGVPWANRACSFAAADCWGLIVLYYRHVLGVEIHQAPGYESDSDFHTCYEGGIVCWRQQSVPDDNCMFVAYVGSRPVHVGLIVDRQALHSRGESGAVRLDKLRTLQKIFTKVEFYSYAGH